MKVYLLRIENIQYFHFHLNGKIFKIVERSRIRVINISACLGEPSKRIFGKSWAFGPTSGPPPPLPVSWAAQKRKKSLMFILHFRLF